MPFSGGPVAGELITRLAADLHAAETGRRPIKPLTGAHPGLTLADAYSVQRANIERRMRGGEKLAGHKIGLTAKVMQELFGVQEPDYGHLLDTMFLDAAKPVNLGELIDPQIEVEPAFILGKRLQGPGLTVRDVLAATDSICVCFEIIDSRIIDWNVKLQDTVADNGSSARVVMGSKKVRPAELALDNLRTELELDGSVVETGNTSAILGHPANGIAWLANSISAFGIALEAGHIVLPGTPIRSVRIAGRSRAHGRIAGLGGISIDLTGTPSVNRRN